MKDLEQTTTDMYNDFAYSYDILMNDVDYKKRTEYLCSLFNAFDRMPTLMLDLACGTGEFSNHFAKQGVSVIGVDVSYDMLSVAREKTAEAGNDILYLCQDAAELDLYGTIDGAICCLDSLNHITDYDRFCKAIGRVSLFLEKDRLFCGESARTTAKITTIHGMKYAEMIKNSAIYVAGTVFLAVLFPNISGYIVAKYKFKLNGFITNLAIVTMVIPTIGSVTTTYRFLESIGLLGSFWGVFLMSAGGFGFGFLLFRNFYAAIPWEYAESAFLDGASNWRVFISIMAPQARPIIVSIAIVSFISCWNDYYTPYMYLNDYPTVAFGLNAIYSKYQNSMPYVFAAMTFTTGVVLLLFCCFSKMIMNSMSAGGLKG